MSQQPDHLMATKTGPPMFPQPSAKEPTTKNKRKQQKEENEPRNRRKNPKNGEKKQNKKTKNKRRWKIPLLTFPQKHNLACGWQRSTPEAIPKPSRLWEAKKPLRVSTEAGSVHWPGAAGCRHLEEWCPHCNDWDASCSRASTNPKQAQDICVTVTHCCCHK